MAQRTQSPPLSVLVGANVFRLRVTHLPKMSQEDLASRSGVSVNTITNLEAGRDPKRAAHNVRLETVQMVANGLGVDAVDLFRDDWTTRVFIGGPRTIMDLVDLT